MLTVRQVRWRPRVPGPVMRLGARQLGRRCLDPALPWQVQRERLNQLAGAAFLPRGTRVTEQVLGGVGVEEVVCGDPSSAAVVVHFHGGGYCVGSPLLARAWAAHLSLRTGCRVVLPDYRLAPEHPYPAALKDARGVMEALSGSTGSGSTGSGSTAPGSVVVSGDSAGGGLALAVLLSMRDAGQRLPSGCILLSPWLDLGRDRRANGDLVRRDVLLSPQWLDACARAYADPAAWSDPLVSPLRGTHSGLPPLLVQAGTSELLAPDAELLAESASSAGLDVSYTRWPRMWHDFALQPGLLAAADSAVAQAAWFVTSVTGRA